MARIIIPGQVPIMKFPDFGTLKSELSHREGELVSVFTLPDDWQHLSSFASGGFTVEVDDLPGEGEKGKPAAKKKA